MIHLPLRAAERRAFMAALVQSHRARTTVEILDRDEKNPVELTGRVIEGAVNVDRKQPVDRSLDLTLADVSRRFGFAPDAPQEFALFADNFIRVQRGIYVAALEQWVDVPLFCGPVTRLQRTGDTVNVTAIGKESLGLAPALAWTPLHIPKGTPVVEAIRTIMRQQGERHFDLPDARAKLRKPVSMGRQSQPWKVASKLANSIDRDLFYDGRGRLRLRTLPPQPVFRFREGEGGSISQRPEVAFDMDAVRNTVQVLGPKPEGQQKRIRYAAFPPHKNPLSPWRLARNGEPRFLVEVIEAEHIHRQEQAKNMAHRKLDDLLRASIDVRFEAVPIYPLEPGDLVSVDVDEERLQLRLDTFSLPLVAGRMSVGDNRRVGFRKGRK